MSRRLPLLLAMGAVTALVAPPAGRPGRAGPLGMARYNLASSPNRWGNQVLEPGFGGPWPGDPNAPRYNVTVRHAKTGESHTMEVPRDRYIYFAFEDANVSLPIHDEERMCRNGCCTRCAAKIVGGSDGRGEGVKAPKIEGALGLLKDLKREGWVLMCCSLPRGDVELEVQDEDEVYIKQFGSTFDYDGSEWGGFLIEDD
mmetsp:Transcript_4241/g.14409  ORF Transcript_4241/g.14409 Transcript_4241/m.14409 type:complete len:200 (-) Transcript_4241:57-656(-)